MAECHYRNMHRQWRSDTPSNLWMDGLNYYKVWLVCAVLKKKKRFGTLPVNNYMVCNVFTVLFGKFHISEQNKKGLSCLWNSRCCCLIRLGSH